MPLPRDLGSHRRREGTGFERQARAGGTWPRQCPRGVWQVVLGVWRLAGLGMREVDEVGIQCTEKGEGEVVHSPNMEAGTDACSPNMEEHCRGPQLQLGRDCCRGWGWC